MKSMFVFALSAALALSLTAFGGGAAPGQGAGGQGSAGGAAPDGSGVQIPSPITEYSSLEEATAAAGFSMTVPASVDGCPERVFQVFNVNTDNVMLEVICRSGEGEIERAVYIRKAPGSADIGGDYNQYTKTSVVQVGELNVTMQGDNGQVRLATWTGDGYTYSVGVHAGEGISGDSMAELVAAVR